MPPAWWLNSCCCKQEDFQNELMDNHGEYLLEAPLEWHARADHFSRVDDCGGDDNDGSSQHGRTDTTRARELHLRFWTAENAAGETVQLASWVAVPDKSDCEKAEEPLGKAAYEDELISEQQMSSFYQDYNAQMTLHEAYPCAATRPEYTLLEPFAGEQTFRARDSAQFILEESSSNTSAKGNQPHISVSDSSSLPPIQVRAEDLVSSVSSGFLKPKAEEPERPSACFADAATSSTDSFDDAEADCSVGEEGVTKQMTSVPVNMLVAKRNKFIRIGDFTTSVDEKIWRLGRQKDERQFTQNQIEAVEHTNAIQKLLDGPFTRQQFSLFHDDELAEFEPHTLVIHVAERRVPYILIFGDVEQKQNFITRLDRMRRLRH